MTGIFRPGHDSYVDVPMLTGERVIRQQTASYLRNGKSMWGGQLVLTDQRLLFRPLDVAAGIKIAHDGIELLPDGLAVFGKLVTKALDYTSAYGDRLAGAVSTATITGVRTGMNAALFHPPSLVLAFADGRQLEVGILDEVGSPNVSHANAVARDEMTRLIGIELAAQR